MSLGLRMKEVRKNRKMTLKTLGEKSNLSPSFLCDAEKDRTNPSIDALQRIATVLETSLSYLLGESQLMNVIPQSLLEFGTKLSSTEQGGDVVRYLESFNQWSESDQQELLQYLKIKHQLRNTETGA